MPTLPFPLVLLVSISDILSLNGVKYTKLMREDYRVCFSPEEEKQVYKEYDQGQENITIEKLRMKIYHDPSKTQELDIDSYSEVYTRLRLAPEYVDSLYIESDALCWENDFNQSVPYVYLKFSPIN